MKYCIYKKLLGMCILQAIRLSRKKAFVVLWTLCDIQKFYSIMKWNVLDIVNT